MSDFIFSEKDLQKQCIAYMKLKNIVYTHQGNEFVRGKINQCKAKNSGMVAGVPDLIIFLQNRVLLVELKTDEGSLRDTQKEFIARVEAVGHKVHIVRDFETFIDLLSDVKKCDKCSDTNNVLYNVDNELLCLDCIMLEAKEIEIMENKKC